MRRDGGPCTVICSITWSSGCSARSTSQTPAGYANENAIPSCTAITRTLLHGGARRIQLFPALCRRRRHAERATLFTGVDRSARIPLARARAYARLERPGLVRRCLSTPVAQDRGQTARWWRRRRRGGAAGLVRSIDCAVLGYSSGAALRRATAALADVCGVRRARSCALLVRGGGDSLFERARRPLRAP